jgi:membrane associated rhomboid family serine protease
MRHVAGATLLVLAAEIVHRTGHSDQQWQYVAVAAALVPQALVDALAVRDTDRRERLRVSTRPAPLLLVTAVVLGVAATAMLLSGGSAVVAAAALCATAGLAVAAAPVSVTIAARSAEGRRTPRRRPEA